MKRTLAVAILGLVLAAPAATGAPWAQAGSDATRDGHVDEVGPTTGDVAFEVELPGFYSDDIIFYAPTGPMIHNGSAYVPIRAMDWDEEAMDEMNWTLDGIVRVDLDTGQVEPLVELDKSLRVAAAATDGDRLFLSSFIWTELGEEGPERLEAYNVSDGDKVWSWDAPSLFDPSTSHTAGCTQPAVVDGVVYHACNQRPDTGGDPDQAYDAQDQVPGPGQERREAYIVGLDTETGEEELWWTSLEEPGARSSQIRGLSVIGNHLFATEFVKPQGALTPCMAHDAAPSCDSQPSGHAFDAKIRLIAIPLESGANAWTKEWEIRTAQLEAAGEEAGSPDVQGISMTAQPTGTATEVYMRLPHRPGPTVQGSENRQQSDRIVALNPGDGSVRWSETVGKEDVSTRWGHGALALGDEALYTTSTQNLYRIDTDPHHQRWSTILDPSSNEVFWAGDPVLGEDRFYTTTDWTEENGSSLYAVNKTTGEIAWSREMPSDSQSLEYKAWNQNHYVSLGEGILAVVGGDGTFRVIGETNASLEPRAQVATPYPGVGEEVAVNLSGTEPGAFGNATRYKAVWGDGTETPWQASPVLTHAYSETGDVTARFVVGNDANQTSSTTQTFHVGQEAPTEPNWIEERFQKENQDMTFGVLGLAVALGGGFIGVARRKRKQSLLQDELEALEEGFEETRDQPSECEAFLDNRKARARSLAVDGYLKEEQVSIIENRAEELRGKLRVSMLDERFAFLPYGMVQTLERMLEDGRINAWEKETFLDALDEQEMLTEEQKGKVERLIGQWLDEGGMER